MIVNVFFCLPFSLGSTFSDLQPVSAEEQANAMRKSEDAQDQAAVSALQREQREEQNEFDESVVTTSTTPISMLDDLLLRHGHHLRPVEKYALSFATQYLSNGELMSGPVIRESGVGTLSDSAALAIPEPLVQALHDEFLEADVAMKLEEKEVSMDRETEVMDVGMFLNCYSIFPSYFFLLCAFSPCFVGFVLTLQSTTLTENIAHRLCPRIPTCLLILSEYINV